METKRETAVLRASGDAVEGVIDEVASELPVRLIVNSEPLVTLLCTPAELPELAVGFLLSEGFIRTRDDLRSCEVSEKDLSVTVTLSGNAADVKRSFETRTITSGCGKGVTFSASRRDLDRPIAVKGPLLSLEDVRRLLRQFRDISKLYLETGGVHSAALTDGKEILFFSEDIGRHNAVDKLIGKAFLKGVSVGDKILLTSGRVTSEIMTKAGRNRFPVVISRAAPSCMAVSYAEDLAITLIGFARGDRMNIYTRPDRIRM